MSQADSPETLERFHGALELVDVLARKIRRTVGAAAALDDLLSFGREGLLDAARKYDPNRGVPFRAYATFRVRGAMVDGIRASARLPRRIHDKLRALDAAGRVSEGASEDALGAAPPPGTAADAERALDAHLAAMATAMVVGLVAQSAHGEDGEVTSVDGGDSPEDAVGKAELLEVVRRSIDSLPADEATLVRRHYLEGERFDHVAADLGLSKSWASRLHTRAISRLSKRLRGEDD
ncbi:MAG TPA: sigma-70 family RNA polymerase sigma factor [Polyangiaceae bacterium]|nr:sigma-70 family RNA polymerase sigma factor [Polyangiaceae bacterium]